MLHLKSVPVKGITTQTVEKYTCHSGHSQEHSLFNALSETLKILISFK